MIHRVSQICPRRQCLDESRCCCFRVERWSAGAGCCVFTLSHFFILQLVTCEVWFSQLVIKFPCTVHCQTSKTTPCSAWLKPLLASSQPPIPHQPPPTPILQRKGPHPNFGRRHQMVVVFVLFTLSLSLSLCVYYLSMIQHSSNFSLNFHNLTSV